jgi:predicted N-acetyltransferase YhbS
MTTNATTASRTGIHIRRLAREDLDAVVAVDAAILGRTRRAYFERRLAAALRQPEVHVQFAIEENGVFRGHLLARVLEGEFGRTKPALRLEVVSVSPETHSRGLGRALHAALEKEALKRGINDLRTASTWRDHAMLRFLSAMGYSLAPAMVAECSVQAARHNERPVESRQHGGDPNDYSMAPANDYERMPRDTVDVRLLTLKDLDAVVRIDRNYTGRERAEYMRHALEEALRDSAIRISLAARVEGQMAGFIMARADLGDFGRAEPVAIIDTLGVDPGYHHMGVGHALLSQLFVNLGALHIERVETVLAHDHPELIAFFRGAGFAQGQRLAFYKAL